MNRFSSIVENIENKKYFKIKSEIDISIQAFSEGEASYIADSTLASIKGQSGYSIKGVEETTKEDFEALLENGDPLGRPTVVDMIEAGEPTDEQKILRTWEAEFGIRVPTPTDKLEFYHQMRSAGFDGILILNVLHDKLIGKI